EEKGEEEEVEIEDHTEFTWLIEESTGVKVANYVRGIDLSCFGTNYVRCQISTHYFFGILHFKDKIIYVYDSMSNTAYERALEHVHNYARLIPHCLKCLDFGTHNKSYGENPVEKFKIKWMNTPLQDNKYVFGICLPFILCLLFFLLFIDMRLKKEDIFNFDQCQALALRRELAANLWAHGK
ncbi:hypothetical protein A4A49_62030, partial [Nicotiana attenuata]